MNKKSLFCLYALALLVVCSGQAQAHFGMLIPSDSMVMSEDPRTITIDAAFSHPFEKIYMDLKKPEALGVMHAGTKTDLLADAKPVTIDEHQTWSFDYSIKRPGVYQFYMQPQPYWEPTEDCLIIHYTKTVVAAYGDETGWDEEIGLRTEIVPLTRPIGLYAGNTFQGIVKVEGKAVPFAEVEVEFFNQAGQVTAPNQYFITQVVKADQNGIFTYTPPAAGWWGFAALNKAPETITYEGAQKEVELGAVLWLEYVDWQTN